MVAGFSSSNGRCTCGATGCPEACGTIVYYVDPNEDCKDNEVEEPKVHIIRKILNPHCIKLAHQYIDKPRVVNRMMFSKSGFLPKRIREIRK